MSSIALINFTKEYESGYKAVDHLNLSIEGKELIMLVGPSGCGKSTTLRMIAGLEEITEGELWINDRLMNHVEAGKRNLSMVFQNYALYPYMSVYENIAFSLRAGGMKRAEVEQKVKEAAEMLQIENLLDRRPATLSGGQRQRVAIGASFVRNPEIFLLDEPLSNLDAKLRTRMRVEIAQMYRRMQSSMIYVTHDQIEAMTLGTRIVVMNQGVAQQDATPDEIYNRPANKFVAGFIGSPQMNFLKCIIICDDGKMRIIGKDFRVELPWQVMRKLQAEGVVENKVEAEIGIRPEHFLPGTSGDYSNYFGMQIDVRENLGSEQLFHGTIGGEKACVRLDHRHNWDADRKDMVLHVNLENIHVFDAKTQRSLFHGADLKYLNSMVG